MGQVLHGSARTTEAVRRAIHRSQASLRALAKRCGIDQKTVAKWKRCSSPADLRTGPKEARSTTLSIDGVAVVVAFRRHTLLPLDDCLYALLSTIPHLTRSTLHRCLHRHGNGRRPAARLLLMTALLGTDAGTKSPPPGEASGGWIEQDISSPERARCRSGRMPRDLAALRRKGGQRDNVVKSQ